MMTSLIPPSVDCTTASGFAAVRVGRPGEDDICFGYGDTIGACKAAARQQLQWPHDQAGVRIYDDLEYIPLDAEQASEVSAMLDAPWVW
jgi:hypothetical protein